MDNELDIVAEGEHEIMELNAHHFAEWLVDNDILSKDDVMMSPWKVGEAVDRHFKSFKEDILELYANQREDERMRWGHV